MGLTLTSSAFKSNGIIPSRYTCEGENVSPPLAWDGVPNGTKSLALIVDDPDAPDPKAPKRVWVHWVVYNLPPDTRELPENADATTLRAGAALGLNDFKRTVYSGACPPIGRHRYFHKLYALDMTLESASVVGNIEPSPLAGRCVEIERRLPHGKRVAGPLSPWPVG
jgi:Raf kinase inhibitor-like YbhB/YbcL family protein